MQRCFLDVDGVLADWTGGMHKAWGIDFDYRHWPYRKGLNGWLWYEDAGKTFADWDAVCDFNFWRNLQWMPHGHDILRRVLEFFEPEQITLLTTPMPHIESASGKMAWIEKNLPEYKQRTIICSAPKKILAQVPHSVLIDDCQKNVEQWWANEGMAVLCPAWWNDGYPNVDNPGHVVRDGLQVYQSVDRGHSWPATL